MRQMFWSAVIGGVIAGTACGARDGKCMSALRRNAKRVIFKIDDYRQARPLRSAGQLLRDLDPLLQISRLAVKDSDPAEVSRRIEALEHFSAVGLQPIVERTFYRMSSSTTQNLHDIAVAYNSVFEMQAALLTMADKLDTFEPRSKFGTLPRRYQAVSARVVLDAAKLTANSEFVPEVYRRVLQKLLDTQVLLPRAAAPLCELLLILYDPAACRLLGIDVSAAQAIENQAFEYLHSLVTKSHEPSVTYLRIYEP